MYKSLTIRVGERKFHELPRYFWFMGSEVPENESSAYGTFAPGSESTWARKFHNSYYSAAIYSLA